MPAAAASALAASRPGLWSRVVLWPGLALALAACVAAGPPDADTGSITGAEVVATSSYQVGHRMGCIDGESLVGRPSVVVADEARLAHDPAYAAGWRDGQRECYEAVRKVGPHWLTSGL